MDGRPAAMGVSSQRLEYLPGQANASSTIRKNAACDLVAVIGMTKHGPGALIDAMIAAEMAQALHVENSISIHAAEHAVAALRE
mmetsp:Transcript_46878/g.87878  ORF Transcript_46878/g.87878 Transcript_46878/m.87878 type:complete len:84 (+) Transcript_46878:101-352(+)